MWEHRCNILHQNDLSDKVQQLENIDGNIQSLLRMNLIALHPHERRIFYIPKASLFSKTQKFRREWLLKADNIYQNHLKGLARPSTYKKEIRVIKSWLQVIPQPISVTPATPAQRRKKEYKKKKYFNGLNWLGYNQIQTINCTEIKSNTLPRA